VRDLSAALAFGSTIEDAAQHLCRSATIDDVRRKAAMNNMSEVLKDRLAVQREG